MSVRAYYDTWCDGPGDAEDDYGCGQWADGATGDTKREARKRAKAMGWKYKRDVGDLCPRCQKRLAS